MTSPIRTPNALAWRIHVRLHRLRFLAENAVRHYRPFKKISKGGKSRLIHNPDSDLKEVQKRIDVLILKRVLVQPNLHGGVYGRSPRTNAEVHLGRRRVVRIDVRDFFPSITSYQVYRVFIDQLSCTPPVAKILTPLTTYRGCIPLGAPTSMSLANMALADADEEIREIAELAGVDYTRFVDDIVFSGEHSMKLIADTIDILRRAGFSVSRRKIQVMPRNIPQIVTGYCVNLKRSPSVTRSNRSNIRAAIRELKIHDIDSQAYNDLLLSIRGRIQFIKGTNPGSAKRLERALLGT